MWLLIGELRRLIERPKPKDGSKPATSHQAQVLVDEVLGNGEVRESLFTVGVDQPSKFVSLVGKRIFLEVSPFARKDGSLGLMRAPDGLIKLFSEALLDT